MSNQMMDNKKKGGKMEFTETYIGCKIIKAFPMSEDDFLRKVKNKEIDRDRDDRPGYCVLYPDGYKSWSPKEVFESAYRKITRTEFELLGYWMPPDAQDRV